MILTSQEWDKFFELLEKITDARRPQKEKCAKVAKEAEDRNLLAELEEFANWDFT